MLEIEIDDLDRALIDALGARPRASWASLARVLGSDEGTLARRWRLLVHSGAASLVVLPGHAAVPSIAVVEVECAPSEVRRIAEGLRQEDAVLSLDITTGARDLVLIVGASHHEAISEFILHRLTDIPGLRAVRIAFADSRVYGDANLPPSVLNGRQLHELERIPLHAERHSGTVSAALERLIGNELADDGRKSIAAIAKAIGVSDHIIRTSLAALLATDRLQLRVRVPLPFSTKPVKAWFFAKVDPMRVGEAIDYLMRQDSVRFLAATHGRFDVAMSVRLDRIDDAATFVENVAQAMPAVRFVDRSVVLDEPRRPVPVV